MAVSCALYNLPVYGDCEPGGFIEDQLVLQENFISDHPLYCGAYGQDQPLLIIPPGEEIFEGAFLDNSFTPAQVDHQKPVFEMSNDPARMIERTCPIPDSAGQLWFPAENLPQHQHQQQQVLNSAADPIYASLRSIFDTGLMIGSASDIDCSSSSSSSGSALFLPCLKEEHIFDQEILAFQHQQQQQQEEDNCEVIPKSISRKCRMARKRRTLPYDYQMPFPFSTQKSIEELAAEKNFQFLLQKHLKPSDVGSLGRIVLPKKEAENCLPYLTAREGMTIVMEDLTMSCEWHIRFRFWPNNKSRMYLLENTGEFIRSHGLKEGDLLRLYKDPATGKYAVLGMKGPSSEDSRTSSPSKNGRSKRGAVKNRKTVSKKFNRTVKRTAAADEDEEDYSSSSATSFDRFETRLY